MHCLHDLTNVGKLCRICLSDGSNNIPLENAFQRSGKVSSSILCALEKVMCMKLELDDNYPSNICPNCLSLLNVAYDLRERFRDSQKILKEHLTKCLEAMEENDGVLIHIVAEENDLRTPKMEHLENIENVEYIYEENVEELKEYLQQSDGESKTSIDYVKESDDNIINNSIQKNNEFQIKQFDIDKYTIEKPVEANFDVTDYGLKNRSSYEENVENLEEYLTLKMEQEDAQQSEGESETSPTDYVEESNESNDKTINNSFQINTLTNYNKNKLQIKQLDIDKYIIEKPVKADSAVTDHGLKNLSSLDEELIQAAYKLKYECPGCPKIYSTLKNLRRHQEVCVRFKQLIQSPISTVNGTSKDVDLFEEDLPYECNRCFKCYVSSDELDHHKELVHSELKLNLNVYQEFKLENLSELDQELFKGALLLKYECNTCPKVYSSSDKLEKHKLVCEKLKRKSSKAKAVARNTPTCQDGEAQQINENLSQTDVESAPSQHKCPNCGSFYQTEDRFKRHLMNCEPKELNIEVYSCEICGHVSTSKKSDLYHKQTVHAERKYACEKCGKLFALKGVLKQHMQMHAKDVTKVVCPICGKSFHYNSGLYYHMKMHKKELNYLCDYCDRRCINLNALKRHLATHTGERRYQCRTCSKRFKGNSELTMHERRHTDHRPYRCDYCGKSYASKSNLQCHAITHSGRVACDWCEKKFTHPNALQLHMRIKHKICGEDS